jgi:hypothetical protein
VANPRAVHVKARAVLRRLGHPDDNGHREYKDWHLEIRGGVAYVTIWHSGRMVFLSLSNAPVFHVPGSWEQYLDRLFQRTTGQ